ncbi:MAG TPA: endonuclease/exonuclease/phosphatase family protein [Chitinophagaceae bacterium]|nr:endonuclease/exonuclease/phosphatase family protein [Chitinophagaceae bacterium]
MLRRAAGNLFLLGYIIATVLFLVASLTTYVNPANWWHVGFVGLLFPYLLLVLIVLTIICIFFRPKFALIGILAILLSYKNISSLFAIAPAKEFVMMKESKHVRVMTWNVRRFTPYYSDFFDPEDNNLNAIVEEVENYDPDIICFQEFYTSVRKSRNLELFQKMGYKYYAFALLKSPNSSSNSGTIIFSRYPILKSYIYDMPREISTHAEDPVAADILIGGDTIRVATFHMQSYGFLNRDYQDLYRIKSQADTGLKASRNIYRKMRYAFTLRGMQADVLHEKMSSSPYPVVLCGDLNDVPSSYSYVTIRGEFKDAFLEKGSGLGKTFMSGRSRFLSWLPTLRIDYIFVDPGLEVMQYRQVTRQLSDHRGLITDIELPKK